MCHLCSGISQAELGAPAATRTRDPRLRRGQLAERDPRSFVALVREFRKLWGDFACWRTDSNYVITIIWRARVMSGVVMANTRCYTAKADV